MPPTRSQLASLLFADADDPLRALRWSLAEVRRGLGEGGVAGRRSAVVLAAAGRWWTSTWWPTARGSEAVRAAGAGVRAARGARRSGTPPAFETWLLSKQRHLAATSEAMLHEAALGLAVARETSPERGIGFAVRAAAMSPLDENHHALLIRLYRLGR